MGTSDIRSAVTATGLRLAKANQCYGEGGRQILQFTGWHFDGTPFAFVSAPFRGDPVLRAIQIARDLIHAHYGRTMPAPQQIKSLAGTLREQLMAAVARANAISDSAKAEVGNLHSVLDTAESTVREVKAAAADIQSALGLTSNGGPPGPLSDAPSTSEK